MSSLGLDSFDARQRCLVEREVLHVGYRIAYLGAFDREHNVVSLKCRSGSLGELVLHAFARFRVDEDGVFVRYCGVCCSGGGQDAGRQ